VGKDHRGRGFFSKAIAAILTISVALGGCGSKVSTTTQIVASQSRSSVASLSVVPTVKASDGVRTQALGHRLSAADVNHLVVWVELQDGINWDPVRNPDGSQLGVDLSAGDIGNRFTIFNLVRGKTYRVRARAFSHPGNSDADRISIDGRSEATVSVGLDDFIQTVSLGVQLSDKPFSGEFASGIEVKPGDFLGADRTFISTSSVIPNLGFGPNSLEQGEQVSEVASRIEFGLANLGDSLTIPTQDADLSPSGVAVTLEGIVFGASSSTPVGLVWRLHTPQGETIVRQDIPQSMAQQDWASPAGQKPLPSSFGWSRQSGETPAPR